MNFNSTIYGLGSHGWTSLPWQASESYLSPLNNGKSYFYRSTGKNRVIEVNHTAQHTKSSLTALKITSYLLTLFILPMIAYTVKALYRLTHKIEIYKGTGSSTRIFNSIQKKPTEIETVLKNTASFSEIQKHSAKLNLNDVQTELLSSPISYQPYTENGDNQPVFLIQEGVSANLSEAKEWHKAMEKRMSDHIELVNKRKKDGQELPAPVSKTALTTNESIPTFSYAPNVGLIKQARLIEGELCWVEPLSGKKLGEEGFQNPYFFPLDGYTYELDEFIKYVNEQHAKGVEDIPSPVNSKITFSVVVELYPNKDFFKVVNSISSVPQPHYAEKILQIPIPINE